MTTAAHRSSRNERRQTVGQFFERHIAYILILPTLLGIAIVNLYPVAYAFVISLQEKKLSTSETTFIGFANYRRILTDPEVWNSIRLSLIFTVASVGLSFADWTGARAPPQSADARARIDPLALHHPVGDPGVRRRADLVVDVQ